MEGWERAREHFVACRGKFVIREREAQDIHISATLGERDDRLGGPLSTYSLHFPVLMSFQDQSVSVSSH